MSTEEVKTKGLMLVGRGAFSQVYRKSDREVLIKSRDPVKECMSLTWFPNSRIFPTLTKIGTDDDGLYSFYVSKYYQRVRSLKSSVAADDWEFYNILRQLPVAPGYNHWYLQFSLIPNKFKGKRKALLGAVDALANYGSDICFEISPRNVAAQNNKLVLLDCFYLKSALQEVRTGKRF